MNTRSERPFRVRAPSLTKFVSLTQQPADALHVAADAFLTSRVDQIIKLALSQMLPTLLRVGNRRRRVP
jgi:hypothetical protein